MRRQKIAPCQNPGLHLARGERRRPRNAGQQAAGERRRNPSAAARQLGGDIADAGLGDFAALVAQNRVIEAAPPRPPLRLFIQRAPRRFVAQQRIVRLRPQARKTCAHDQRRFWRRLRQRHRADLGRAVAAQQQADFARPTHAARPARFSRARSRRPLDRARIANKIQRARRLGDALDMARQQGDSAVFGAHRFDQARARQAGQNLGFRHRLVPFVRRARIGDDAATDSVAQNAARKIDHRRANRHIKARPATAQNPDRAAIDAARRALQSGDDSHRRAFRRARHRRARKQRRQQIRKPGARAGAHRRDHLHHGRIRFDLQQLARRHRARVRQARQIVAQHIDNHQIFGAVFARNGERRRGVRGRGASAFHRSARDDSVFGVKKQFGRSRTHRPIVGAQKRRVRRRLTRRQIAHQRPRRAAKTRPQRKCEIDLIGLPGGDLRQNRIDRGAITRARNRRSDSPQNIAVDGRGHGLDAARGGESREPSERQNRIRRARGQIGIQRRRGFAANQAGHEIARARAGFGAGDGDRDFVRRIGAPRGQRAIEAKPTRGIFRIGKIRERRHGRRHNARPRNQEDKMTAKVGGIINSEAKLPTKTTEATSRGAALNFSAKM